MASAAVFSSAVSDDVTQLSVSNYVPEQKVFSKSILGGGMNIAHTIVVLSLVEEIASRDTNGRKTGTVSNLPQFALLRAIEPLPISSGIGNVKME